VPALPPLPLSLRQDPLFEFLEATPTVQVNRENLSFIVSFSKVFLSEDSLKPPTYRFKELFSLLKDYPNAQYELALRLMKGEGEERWRSRGKVWVEKRACEGHPRAVPDMAYYYTETGELEEAVPFMIMAAESGHELLAFNLGRMYFYGEGVAVNKEKAYEWFLCSSKKGFAAAQNSLGWMFQHGDGVAKDKDQAIRWYSEAIEGGDTMALTNKGLMFQMGDGVQQDYKEAARLYEIAADRGDMLAQYNLGLLYERGEGVKRDEKEAAKWFTLAAKQGHLAAQRNMGWRYFNGYGVTQYKREALELLTRVAKEDEEPILLYHLGLMYERGEVVGAGGFPEGVPRDLNKAIRWLMPAAKKGYAPAQYELGEIYRRSYPQQALLQNKDT
jgi:TPR repeat protein